MPTCGKRHQHGKIKGGRVQGLQHYVVIPENLHNEAAGYAREYHSAYSHSTCDEIEPPGLRGPGRGEQTEGEANREACGNHQKINGFPLLDRNQHINRGGNDKAEEKGPGQHRILGERPGY